MTRRESFLPQPKEEESAGLHARPIEDCSLRVELENRNGVADGDGRSYIISCQSHGRLMQSPGHEGLTDRL